jgi:hypothetical protein
MFFQNLRKKLQKNWSKKKFFFFLPFLKIAALKKLTIIIGAWHKTNNGKWKSNKIKKN